MISEIRMRRMHGNNSIEASLEVIQVSAKGLRWPQSNFQVTTDRTDRKENRGLLLSFQVKDASGLRVLAPENLGHVFPRNCSSPFRRLAACLLYVDTPCFFSLENITFDTDIQEVLSFSNCMQK
jgi:hypothetical protein